MFNISFLLGILIPILSGCLPHKNDSQLNIINGHRAEDDQFPSVVKIRGCTATFIKKNIMLTAAHCVCNEKEKKVVESIAIVNPFKASSNQIFINDVYGCKKDQKNHSADLAIVKFPPDTSKKWTPLCRKLPKQGKKAIMVGYGCNSHQQHDGEIKLKNCSGKGKRRIGHNILDKDVLESDSFIRIEGLAQTKAIADYGDGQNSVGAPGDSGGPLIVRQNGQYCVAGVTSYGNIQANDKSRSWAKYVNIHNDNSDFLNPYLLAKAFSI